MGKKKSLSPSCSGLLRGWPPATGVFKLLTVVLPKTMKASVLLDDEQIIMVLRQHWIVLVPKLLITLSLIIITPVLVQSAASFQHAGLLLLILAYLLCYLIISGYVLQSLAIWFFNVYIITDERMIDVAFDSILSSDISVTKTDKIQDHSIKTNGFWPTVLNYGTIFIQTAGEQNEFAFQNIPQATKVNRLIGELILEEEREAMEGRAN